MGTVCAAHSTRPAGVHARRDAELQPIDSAGKVTICAMASSQLAAARVLSLAGRSVLSLHAVRKQLESAMNQELITHLRVLQILIALSDLSGE
jgi:carbamoylphosphate synthase large subunit